MTTNNSNFSNNSARFDGGGAISGDQMTIISCNFTGNESAALFGGGAILGAGTISNSSFSHNSALNQFGEDNSGSGGAVNWAGTIVNSTFYGNGSGNFIRQRERRYRRYPHYRQQARRN